MYMNAGLHAVDFVGSNFRHR